ncbi:fused MFS/spermidine synthase [Actinocorallia longicatena]|uniref:Fused MFS/spermidine synthase n=1 Tax=Actinocorallia longicatena TaxID=111803 RepID=A0ABP6QMY1_9ACTN
MSRSGGARRAADRPAEGRYPIAQGEAELVRDPDRDGGWVITIAGVPQSYVDLDDPRYLDFEYMRLLGDVVDHLDDGPLDAVHVGGAGCTLARYIGTTRPGSRQVVLELDGKLVQLVRDQLDLKSVRGLKVRIGDGREGVAALPAGADDLVVLDAFSGAVMPTALASREFVEDVARVLRADGVLLVNVADGSRLSFARRLAATVQSVFPHTLLLAEPGVLRGRRFGNLVLAGSRTGLPIASLTRISAGKPIPARCLDHEELARFASGYAPIHDGDEVEAPVPPASIFN